MSRPRVIREIGLYLVVVYALALGVSLALPDANINMLLTVLLPTVTVAILTFAATPRGRRREIWHTIGLGRPGGGGPATWMLAFVIPIALMSMAYGAALALGVAELEPVTVTGSTAVDWSLNFAIGLVIGTVIILGEEIGWRGFLLPRFQQLTSRRRAALVTGFCHGCFHLPLILIASTYDAAGSRWLVAPTVVITVTFAGVFYAFIWDRSASVWPVAVAHNAANTVFDIGAAVTTATGSTAALAYVAGESGLATLAAAAAIALLLLTRASVWREDAAPLLEEDAANARFEASRG